jgi:hypothetical protein
MWKTMFGKQADSLERVTEKEDECENFPHLLAAQKARSRGSHFPFFFSFFAQLASISEFSLIE